MAISNIFKYLIVSPEVFLKTLEDSIKKGQKIIENVEKLRAGYDETASLYLYWDDFNTEVLKSSFSSPPKNIFLVEYTDITKSLQLFSSSYSSSKHVRLLRIIEVLRTKINYLEMIKTKANAYKIIYQSDKKIENHIINTANNQVFVVHGHDELTKLEVVRFIEKLGLEPIVLHEQPTAGKTIIEKIEKYSNVGFAIVLYTACDIGALKSQKKKLNPRARQNVVFEHGYLIAKIGRNNVCGIVKDNVEIPTDISGLVYIPYNGNWRFELARELTSSNYSIDINKAI